MTCGPELHSDYRRSTQQHTSDAHQPQAGPLIPVEQGRADTTGAAAPAFARTLLGDARLRGRGNGPVRQTLMQNMQRTHGNRAVQRQADGWPTDPSGRYKPDEWPKAYGGRYTDGQLVQMGEMRNRERQLKLTMPELVQEHLAELQGTIGFYDEQEAQKQAGATDDAQRAITGLPPDWAMLGGGDHNPRTLEKPQYDDVSPALNPYDIKENDFNPYYSY